jgi:hypothetical protein
MNGISIHYLMHGRRSSRSSASKNLIADRNGTQIHYYRPPDSSPHQIRIHHPSEQTRMLWHYGIMLRNEEACTALATALERCRLADGGAALVETVREGRGQRGFHLERIDDEDDDDDDRWVPLTLRNGISPS